MFDRSLLFGGKNFNPLALTNVFNVEDLIPKLKLSTPAFFP
ncbi:hypothetical protein OAW70_00070 [Candidatus Pelagibacter ubique]|nr:hypothetical protein [Candidatus Pelagibacter ubique]MDC3397481.1 hypothetical protein [Candidatus Pelagibacter ubique]